MQTTLLMRFFSFFILASAWMVAMPGEAHAVPPIVFPVIGPASYSNDFNAPRTNGIHGATDIFAPKGRLLVSPVNGTITSVIVPQASWGYSVTVRDTEGYSFRFIHMNNDTPGTDDGQGGPMNAYAADMKTGNPVVAGQLLGYLGDSGNAETTAPHLHFEIFAPDGSLINPYDSLNRASRIPGPVHYPALPNEVLPYPGLTGPMKIAMGNFEGSSTTSEMITGAGSGAPPHVIAARTDGTVLASFYAYSQGFRGGIDVAAGDIDGDGIDEIITGTGPGAGPHVMVYKLNGTPVASFYAFNPSFKGGISVSAGDLDGDGNDEIVVGAGPGAGPHVIAYKADGSTVVASFYAYAQGFKGGVDVAAGDVEGTTDAEIITGAGPGAPPHVMVYQPDGTSLGSFYVYDQGNRSGVRVSAGNIRTSSTKDEILTAPEALPGGPLIKVVTYDGTTISQFNFMESWWLGYHDIGAGYDTSRAATGGNRRASVRVGPS
ncbi:MAG TPA: peptidoglycan DD-metalloendopeptidase family protein [Candidatus Saccharimonadia bacterium]